MKQRSVNISTRKFPPYAVAHVNLLAPIIASLAWELWITPLCKGGSQLTLKTLPLCLLSSGILKGGVYIYQYSSMLALIYLAETVMYLFDATPVRHLCAAAVAAYRMVFFVFCMAFVKQKQKEARHS